MKMCWIDPLKSLFPQSSNQKKKLLYCRFICYCLSFPSPWRLCVLLLPFRGTKLEQVLHVPDFFQCLKKSVHEPPQENPVKKKHTTLYQSPHTSIFICTFFNILFAEAGPKGGMTRKSSLKYWTSQRITQNIQYWYSAEDSGNTQNKEGKRARVIDRERGGGHQLKWVESSGQLYLREREIKLGEVLLLLWCNMSPNRHFGTAEAGNKTVKLNWFVWKLSGALNPLESPMNSCVWILMKAVNLPLHCKGV